MNKNIKLTKRALAMVVSGGIVLCSIGNCYGEVSYKPGTFIEQEMNEEKSYFEYVVKNGDNLSLISQKICLYFDEEPSTKYWPTLAFLNDYPKVIQPGDIIKFPKSFEGLVILNKTLRKKGWTAKYIQSNNIYGTDKKHLISIDTIYSLLEDIYGDKTCVDEDFVRRYLKVHGLENQYELINTDYYDKDIFFILTVWIPTLDEIDEELKELKK